MAKTAFIFGLLIGPNSKLNVHCCAFCGDWFSFTVLSNPHGGGGHTANTTSYDSCGANFCVSTINSNENLERPDDKEIYEISAIYLACIIAAAILISILVDPLSR